MYQNKNPQTYKTKSFHLKPSRINKSRQKSATLISDKTKMELQSRIKTDYINGYEYQLQEKEQQPQYKLKKRLNTNEDPQKNNLKVDNKKNDKDKIDSKQEVCILGKKKKQKSPLNTMMKKKSKVECFNNKTFDFVNHLKKDKDNQCKKKIKSKEKSNPNFTQTKKSKKLSIDQQKKSKSKFKISIQQSSQIVLKPLLANNLITVTTNSEHKFNNSIFTGRTIQQQPQLQLVQRSFQIDPNALLRIHLKKNLRKKLQAVIKIQKIWRGYQTRKLLKQYINQQQSRLESLLRQLKSNSLSKNEEQIMSWREDEQQQQGQININQFKQQQGYNQKKGIQHKYLPYFLKTNPIEVQCFEKMLQNQNKVNIYRHKPIYDIQNLQQIQINLKQNTSQISSKKIQQNKSNIIYQTTQEYAESRGTELEQIDKNQYKHQHTGTVLISDILNYTSNNNPELRIRTQPEQILAKQYQQQQSTKSHYKEQILKIKKEQIMKWQKMIEYMTNNLKNKNNNQKSIIKQIINQSQTNKKWLESLDSSTHKNLQKSNIFSPEPIIHSQFIQETRIRPIKDFQLVKDIPQNKIQKKNIKKKKLCLNLQKLWLSDSITKVESNRDFEKKLEIRKSQIRELLQRKYSDLKCNDFEEILNVREQLLLQRQKIKCQYLSKLLRQNKIDFRQYYRRINKIKQYVNKQKMEIDRSRDQIEHSMTIAVNILKKTQKQALLLNKRIRLSKSADMFNNYLNNGFKKYSNNGHNKSQQKKNSSNNNCIIIQDLSSNQYTDRKQYSQLNISVLQRQFNNKNRDQYQQVSGEITNYIIYDAIAEIFMNSNIHKTMFKKYSEKNLTIDPIGKQQKILFMEMLAKYFPDTNYIIENYKQNRSLILLKDYGLTQRQTVNLQSKLMIDKQCFQQITQKLSSNIKLKYQIDDINFHKQFQQFIGFKQFITKKQKENRQKKQTLLCQRLKTLLMEGQSIFDATNQKIYINFKPQITSAQCVTLCNWILIYNSYQQQASVIYNKIQDTKNQIFNLLIHQNIEQLYKQQDNLMGQLMLRIAIEIDFVINQILMSQFSFQMLCIQKMRKL